MALLFLVATVGEAQAGLTICNKAKRAARVALGRFDGLSWVSEGWWSIAPGACEALVKVPLDARYYYLYGTDGAAGVWDGDTAFCTSRQEKFSIVGRAACERRGYDRNRFFRIDTGDSLDKVQMLQ